MDDKTVKNGNKTERNKKGQFEKGNNLGKGRPKKEFTIANILGDLTAAKSIYQPDMTRMEHILLKAVEQAEGGDPVARNFVADRMEGKALERVLKQKTDDILEVK